MDSARPTLERIGDRVAVPEPAHERLLQRRERKRRNGRIAAAAIGVVIFALVVSGVLLEIGSPGRSIPEVGPSPTASVSSLGRRLVAFEGTLRPGRYWVQRGSLHISFEVPPGWSSFHDLAVLGPEDSGVSFWFVDHVSTDPCHWSGRERDAGMSVERLVEALADHPGATSAVDVSLDGYLGKRMDLRVPIDLNVKDCDSWGQLGNHQYVSWWMNGGARYHQGPGQIDRLWILDVHGERLVVDAAFFPKTSPDVRAQVRNIVDSVRIT